jgi:MerR family transcriptional regulator, light-induced transcriptional regulator
MNAAAPPISASQAASGSGLSTGPDPSPVILARTIESEIIPRLLLAHGAPRRLSGDDRSGQPGAFQSEDIEQVAVLAFRGVGPAALLDHLDRVLASGVTLDALFLDLLAPAAARLGRWWEEDAVSFCDVTLALARLQECVRTLAARRRIPQGPGQGAPTILLAPAPGEQHMLGLAILEEMFAESGWRTHVEPTSTFSLLNDWAADTWIDVLGLSVACYVRLDALSPLLRSVRRSSLNPQMRIMLGGHAVNARPQVALQLGADAIAACGRSAMQEAARLVEETRGAAFG